MRCLRTGPWRVGPLQEAAWHQIKASRENQHSCSWKNPLQETCNNASGKTDGIRSQFLRYQSIRSLLPVSSIRVWGKSVLSWSTGRKGKRSATTRESDRGITYSIRCQCIATKYENHVHLKHTWSMFRRLVSGRLSSRSEVKSTPLPHQPFCISYISLLSRRLNQLNDIITSLVILSHSQTYSLPQVWRHFVLAQVPDLSLSELVTTKVII